MTNCWRCHTQQHGAADLRTGSTGPGVTLGVPGVTLSQGLAGGIPRPPSGGDGDGVLPGWCAQLLHPHTTKYLDLSPAGVCLVLAPLREGCSHLHLSVSLPGCPELFIHTRPL